MRRTRLLRRARPAAPTPPASQRPALRTIGAGDNGPGSALPLCLPVTGRAGGRRADFGPHSAQTRPRPSPGAPARSLHVPSTPRSGVRCCRVSAAPTAVAPAARKCQQPSPCPWGSQGPLHRPRRTSAASRSGCRVRSSLTVSTCPALAACGLEGGEGVMRVGAGGGEGASRRERGRWRSNVDQRRALGSLRAGRGWEV